jgi:hypothetical protein
MTALVPTQATLKKYGLTADEWRAILERQGGVCAVCRTLPSSGRLHIDHAHVRGWAKLPPDQRKRHVRGLVCFLANHFWLARQMDAEKARNVAAYLEAFDARLAAANDNAT